MLNDILEKVQLKFKNSDHCSGGGDVPTAKGHKGTFWGNGNTLYILTVVLVP